MSIKRGMDKEEAGHVYKGILFSHKKEWNNATCSNIDGPRHYHTKWSKTDKDKHRMVLCICWFFKNKKKGEREIQKNLHTKQTKRHGKQIYGYQRGKARGIT